MSLQGAFEHFRLVSPSACFGAGIVGFFSADLQKKNLPYFSLYIGTLRGFFFGHIANY